MLATLPIAIAVGGIGTATFAFAQMLMGVTVEWPDLIKYGGAVAGAIWLCAREFQKIKDNQEAMQAAIEKLCKNQDDFFASQESHARSAKQLVDAVRELQKSLPVKKKTEFVAVDTPHRLP